jgi:NTP pyrophosphatase (non-canonical NTP hydrolase)
MEEDRLSLLNLYSSERETGELARDVINAELDLSDGKTGEYMQRKEAMARIEDDIGDVLIKLSQLAITYDLDVAQVLTCARDAMTRFRDTCKVRWF